MSLKCKHTNSFLLQEELASPLTPTAVLQMGLTLRFQTCYRKHTDIHTLLRTYTTQTLFKLLFQQDPRKRFCLTTTCTWPGYDWFHNLYSLSGPAGVLEVTLCPCLVNDPLQALDWVFGILSFLWLAESGRPHSVRHNIPQNEVWHNRPTVLATGAGC